MKKTFLILALGLALNANAVTFQWNSAAQVSFGESLVSALTPATYTAQLVYLGSGGAWSGVTISDAGIDIGSTATKIDDPISSVSGKAGMFASQNSKFSGTTQKGVAGGVYSVLLTYVDKDNTTWYQISSSTYTVPTTADELTTGLTSTFAFSSTKNQVSSGSSVSAGSGWVAVPEPSTAMLALAGLALLIKRRRA